jgi:GntR family transcriptional regulator of arabinose operon
MNHVTDVEIQLNSVVSLHSQLHNQLRQLILLGRWPHGSRLPSETQFAQHLSLSRSTVRLALQQAEIEGLIERSAGRGTFVAYMASKERKNRLITFVTYEFDTENHLLILNGAESEVKARGYQIVFSKAKNHQDDATTLKNFQESDTAGIMMWPNALNSRQQNTVDFQEVHLPIVLMDRNIHGFDCDFVTSDNYGGAQALMQHLVELGHRNVVFLSHHELELSSVMDRYRAYRDVLQETGQTPLEPWLISQAGKEPSARELLQSSIDSLSSDIQTIKEYMRTVRPAPTAIFAVNDYVAVLAVRAMKALGLPIPNAVSIAGFDGTDLAMQLEVPLTTVAQDPFTIGKRAAELLINRIEGYSGPTHHEIIPTQLHIRSSTSVPLRV